jgi:hypothetical protein
VSPEFPVLLSPIHVFISAHAPAERPSAFLAKGIHCPGMFLSYEFTRQQIAFTVLAHKAIALLPQFAFDLRQFSPSIIFDFDMKSHKSDSFDYLNAPGDPRGTLRRNHPDASQRQAPRTIQL